MTPPRILSPAECAAESRKGYRADLLATLEAYRAIVEALAECDEPVTSGLSDEGGDDYCTLCHAVSYSGRDGQAADHAPDCPWVRARVLTGKDPAP